MNRTRSVVSVLGGRCWPIYLALLVTLGCGGGSSSPTTQIQTSPPPSPYTFSVPHSFGGGTDGGFSRSALVLDSAGNLYGTTSGGNGAGIGSVFKLTPGGSETVLFNFTGQGDVGFDPYGGVTLDPQGNLYGATFYGGNSLNNAGTIFQITPSGQMTTLYSFPGAPGNPEGGVIRDTNGNLYGVTVSVTCDASTGCGDLFEVQPSGEEITLHTFGLTGGDGKTPTAGLLLVGNTLYGTTAGGGAFGFGTVFDYNLTTSVETVFYSFTGGQNDGSEPGYGALIQDTAGNLYGTTTTGGHFKLGTVFKVNPATQVETVLYNFTGGTDGQYPYGGLVQDSQGSLYGTTYQGGNEAAACGISGCGAVFKLVASGQLTVLYNFSGDDGENPWSSLVFDAAGDLYGTTNAGGANGFGNVFKLTP